MKREVELEEAKRFIIEEGEQRAYNEDTNSFNAHGVRNVLLYMLIARVENVAAALWIIALTLPCLATAALIFAAWAFGVWIAR